MHGDISPQPMYFRKRIAAMLSSDSTESWERAQRTLNRLVRDVHTLVTSGEEASRQLRDNARSAQCKLAPADCRTQMSILMSGQFSRYENATTTKPASALQPMMLYKKPRAIKSCTGVVTTSLKLQNLRKRLQQVGASNRRGGETPVADDEGVVVHQVDDLLSEVRPSNPI